MRELTATFTNWDINDIVLELAKYIDKGFRIGSVREDRHFDTHEIEVLLYEPHRS